MKIATGRVVDGRVEVSTGTLPEGEPVMVVSLRDEPSVTLTPTEEAELFAASEEIRRGELVTPDELVADLRRLAER
jgi:hypothetical protein